jgi:hypothetical protein
MVPGVATQHRMDLFKVDLLQGRHSRESGNPVTSGFVSGVKSAGFLLSQK